MEEEQRADSLWVECSSLWDQVEQSCTRGDSDEFKALLDRCQERFQALGKRVNELCLFSTNETIQDIQTPYLPFILIPYYLALIEQRRMQDRKLHLDNAKVC